MENINFGYTERENGVALSENAEYAESEGKYPRMLFIKYYHLTKSAFDFFVDNGIIITREWHHVGKNFKNRLL